MYQPRPPRMPFNQTYRMQNFQRNPNFVPRGRGPRHGHNSMYRGPPPVQSPNRNEDYWCETCDRGFPFNDMLENHKQQHQKCNIDGCQFIAHPKVITKHIQMQHSTGLFKKIANLNNPEGIQKWREERKKRFPTKENVEKKAAEIKEKIERGEKMGLKKDKNFRNGENQKRSHHENQTYDRKRKMIANPDITNSSNKKRNKKPKKEIPLPPPENIRKLKPFAGILDLEMDNDDEINEDGDGNDFDDKIEDEDDCLLQAKQLNKSSKTEEPAVCGALSTLMCEYGSSDEENEMQTLKSESTASEKIKNISEGKTNNCRTVVTVLSTLSKSLDNKESTNSIISNTIKQEIENRNSVVKITHESEEDSAPEEVKVVKVDEAINVKAKNCTTKQNKNKNDFRNKKSNKNFKPKLPSTLLQKLLHREIQQERNIVLQCIRHIVNNNYFDK